MLDASWHLPNSGRNAKAEYQASHIPGALFFDIDDLSDEKSSLPHMLPSTVKFASRMKKMGVGDGMRIVVYDTHGLFSAARAWLRRRDVGVAQLNVAASNPAALGFWRQVGFRDYMHRMWLGL